MLLPLFKSGSLDSQACALNIVVIPALGLSRPSEWQHPADPPGSLWLRKLVDGVVPNAVVWEHVYSQDRPTSLASGIVGEADTLLRTVYDHYASGNSGGTSVKQPLVFVCHGTGGFVLKNALRICREQLFQYRPVIEVVSGAIFLGSPHLVGDKKDAKRVIDLLLRCQHKGYDRRSASGDIDAESLLEICKGFERTNLAVPVVSIFEAKHTSTPRSVFSKAKIWKKAQYEAVIVPESIGTLKASHETVVKSDADHLDVCKVSVNSQAYKEIEKLFEEVMRDAPRRIAEAGQPYVIPLGLKDGISLRSPSTAGHTRIEELLSKQPSVPTSYPQGGATGGSTTGSFEFVPRETPLEQKARDPTLPCYSLGTRQRLGQFFGRQDILTQMDEVLLPPTPSGLNPDEATGDVLRSFAICGLGGMGKTELATEYAYSRKDMFEAVFWLGADDAKILASNFAQIAQKLGLEDDLSDLAATRDIAMAWLSRPLRKTSEPDTPENSVNWLLIFDNVDNLDVLSDYWPKFGRGAVLVTSRDPFAKHNLYVEQGINLPPLTKLESEAMMQRLTHVKADQANQNALSAIAGELGGLPLAINQMSGVFRQLRLSYVDFLKYYEEEGIESVFQKQAKDGVHGSGPISGTAPAITDNASTIRSLATLWAFDHLSPGTKALLQVICLLDPDGIPEELLIDKAAAVKLPSYPTTRGEYYTARSELIASSLINHWQQQDAPDSPHNSSNISLHRLIQETAKARMTADELAAALTAAGTLVIASWPFQNMKEHHSVARFTACEALFPSVLRLKNGLEPLIQSSTDFPLDIGWARLFNDTGWYMFERGLMEETKPFCDLGLLIGERLALRGGELNKTAVESVRESYSFIGIVLAETNEHALSMEHKKKWLAMLEERISPEGGLVEDYELGYAYNEIGVAYGNNGMLEEAANAFRRSIGIFQGLDDYEDTMLGWPQPNLGFIYWMQGKLQEAEKVLVKILDIHAAAYGVDDTKSFKTGKILYGIGNVLEAQGRFLEAFNFHRRCLKQFAQVLGAHHHRVGDIYHRMAGHCIRQRLYREAGGFLDSALKIFSARSHLINEQARTTYKKGRLMYLTGNHDAANKLLKEAYELFRRLKPQDNRTAQDLTEHDFDQLVGFWSR